MKPFTLKEIEGSGDEPTLMIGGATYDFDHDYDPLAKTLPGTKIIVDNPFQNAERKRPADWENELVDGYAGLCDRYGIKHVVAHSRGTLQAILVALKKELDTVTMLHPPLKKCPPGNESRLNLPPGDPRRAIDTVLTPTAIRMNDTTYETMLERHYERYGKDPNRETLMNIFRYDVQPLTSNENLVREMIRHVENDVAARVLVIAGNYDPWDGPLGDKNKTIVRLNEGHFAHISVPDTVGFVISRWRSGYDVSAYSQSITDALPAATEPAPAFAPQTPAPLVHANAAVPTEEGVWGF